MKRSLYIILLICLCTAGIGTAAHFSPEQAFDNALSAVNDTVDVEEENIEEDEDDEEGDEIIEDEDDEEFENAQDEEDDGEINDEEEDEEEGDEIVDDDDEDDFGFFSTDDEDEFGNMHDDEDEEEDEIEEDDDPTADDSSNEDIELTEGMLISAEEQLEGYNAKNYLSEDTINAKHEFKDADADEYIRRLRRMPVVMEMPYNDVVRKYIDQYTNRMRRSVSVMLGAQNFYNPIFEEALEAEGCPLELRYLPIIESAYNPSATSPVGAAGLWQFMPSTGKSYGLEINSLVDERRDPIKSTKAAAKYLKYLYSYYGDWSLVIAAYNCGPGNVNKAIQRSGGVKDYWTIYNHLPKETRGYVPAFIAANYAMTYYCEHGIEPMQAKLPAETDTIMVSRDLHFKQVADLCDVSIDQIKELNPQYRQQVIPGYWKPCTLRLPNEAISKFIACGDSIYAYQASQLLPRRSTVSISHVSSTPARSDAAKANSTPRTYTKPANNYTRSNNYSYSKNNSYNRNNYYNKNNAYSQKGNNGKYNAYGKNNAYGRNNTYGKNNSYGKNNTYAKNNAYVKPQKQKTAQNGKNYNGKNNVKAQGKTSKAKVAPKKKAAPSSVTIRKGDNLTTIAKRNGTTVDKLKKLNGMKGKDNKIQAGKKLKVK